MPSRRISREKNDALELLPDPEAPDKLTAFFDSLGAGDTPAVALYQVDPANRTRRSFLAMLPDVSELTGPEFMTQVFEGHGAGEYYAEARDSAGKIGLSQRFEVGPIGKPRSIVPAASPPAAAASPKPSDTSPELVAVLNRQTALLEQLVARPPPPSILSGLDVPAVIGAVVSAVTAFRKIAEPIAPPATPASAVAPVDLILKGIELARELRDEAGAGDSEGFLGAFRELLRSPLLAKALDEPRSAAARPKKLPAAAPPSEAPKVSPAPASDSAPAAIDAAKMRRYLVALVGYAAAGSDPELYAELALDNVPEEVLAPLVTRPDALEQAIAIEPTVADHRDWFTALLASLRAAFADDDDDDDDDAPAPAPPLNGAAAAADAT